MYLKYLLLKYCTLLQSSTFTLQTLGYNEDVKNLDSDNIFSVTVIYEGGTKKKVELTLLLYGNKACSPLCQRETSLQ